jgi:DHA2 family multidrug resistance protein
MGVITNKRKRFLITVAVMSATVMQVLDTTIVNVALPDMQGAFGATPDQISWVLTSYLVSSAIFMPLTGYFTDHIGRKWYLFSSILGFTVASALCGISLSLGQMVICRLLQGVFGAALVPLSQAIMMDIYPVEERSKAMAIWGVGVMVGPILGPTLGGYLTEVFNWRWTFYINVPIGLWSLLLAWRIVPDSEKHYRTMELISLACMVFAIGGAQYVLDRGNQDDWFEARSIKIVTFLAVAGFLGYIALSLFRKKVKPIFDPYLFQDRNFVISCTIMSGMGLGLFSSMVIQAMMLESLFGYPTFTTGLAMAPRGIASMIAMICVSKFSHVNPKIFIFIGIILNAVAMYVGTLYNLDISPGWVIIPGIIQGFGIGFVLIALSTVALSTLPPHLIPEGAGLFSLMRILGFSVGMSVVVTILTRHTQIAWNYLSGFLQPFNPAVTHYLQALHIKPMSPLGATILAKEVSRQAQMLSIVDVFIVITGSFLVMFPMIFLLGSPKTSTPKANMAAGKA